MGDLIIEEDIKITLHKIKYDTYKSIAVYICWTIIAVAFCSSGIHLTFK